MIVKKKIFSIIVIILGMVMILFGIGMSLLNESESETHSDKDIDNEQKNEQEKVEEISSLPGTWISTKRVIYTNGELTSEQEWVGSLIDLSNSGVIKICYSNSDFTDYTCEESSYSCDDNSITISENDLYLTGKYIYTIEDDVLSLKTPISEMQDVIFYFERDNSSTIE